MIQSHVLGFPRIGVARELKKALEAYWKGKIDVDGLRERAAELKRGVWRLESESGLDYVTVGDFSYYDSILDFSVAVGAIPERYGEGKEGWPDLMFRMARGKAPSGDETLACEMTKWFDTNYHYIVPEFSEATLFRLNAPLLLEQVEEAKAWGKVKFVVPGAFTYLKLGKNRGTLSSVWDLVEPLKVVYERLFDEMKRAGVSLVQLDEPCLATELSAEEREIFRTIYGKLDFGGLSAMATVYFGEVNFDLKALFELPFAGFHLDGVRGEDQIETAASLLPDGKFLSVGLIDGRNVWKSDMEATVAKARRLLSKLGDRLTVSCSCSLLHVPVDLARETKLDPEIARRLAFARQKLEELGVLKDVLNGREAEHAEFLKNNAEDIRQSRESERFRHAAVKEALAAVTPAMTQRRSPFSERKALQSRTLGLPKYPTTTIGSFPQTADIRKARRAFKNGDLSRADYEAAMKREIEACVRKQTEIGLDVLVHGEPERNDMVEYFGEMLEGFAFTENGWVQSYGSRCVKPPVIHGDVRRTASMTVDWTGYAQSLSERHVKGMLTGPVTILQWSFVRNDQPRETTCKQIALALREEVEDLEKAGVKLIQVDEPALREGLPPAPGQRADYLRWACEAFRLAVCCVGDATQIHTHMCYCEFNEIMDSVASLDADVISIEASRSQMELLDAFRDFEYPNDIGPGVYDIHSPRIPSAEEIRDLLKRASRFVPSDRLWVNPDCGLKTRGWKEVVPALSHMVEAARSLRSA